MALRVVSGCGFDKVLAGIKAEEGGNKTSRDLGGRGAWVILISGSGCTSS